MNRNEVENKDDDGGGMDNKNKVVTDMDNKRPNNHFCVCMCVTDEFKDVIKIGYGGGPCMEWLEKTKITKQNKIKF